MARGPRAMAGLAATLGVLTACSLGPTGPQARGPAKPTARPSADRPASTATGAPGATPTPAGAPAGPLVARLVRPLPGEVGRLEGRLVVDAAYMTQALGARAFDASGQTGLIANNGGSLISNNGGSIVANNGGGLISDKGGGVVSNHGAAIIANNGGGVIALASGNVVAATAGDLGAGGLAALGPDRRVAAAGALAPGTKAYKLAQAAAATPAPAPGGQVPAAGMLVSAVSLATGEYLPVGVDEADKPVYAVYSNMAGGFALTVPKGEEANVLVVATVPGHAEPGATYQTLTPPAAGLVMDEDAAVVTRYLRRAFVARLADILAAPTPAVAKQLTGANLALSQGAAAAAVGAIIDRLHAFGVARGIPAEADPAVKAAHARFLGGAIVDAALAHLDLPAVTIDPAIAPRWREETGRLPGFPAEGARALDVLAECFKTLRARGETAMRGPDGRYKPLEPAFFERVAITYDPSDWLNPALDGQDWFSAVLDRYPPTPYPVTKPAELGDFLVDTYLGVNRTSIVQPVVACYMLLDDRAYPPGPTTIALQGEVTIPNYEARVAEALARLNQRFPHLALGPDDPNFLVAKRRANNAYGTAFDDAGMTFFTTIGLALLDGGSPLGRAVEKAATAAFP